MLREAPLCTTMDWTKSPSGGGAEGLSLSPGGTRDAPPGAAASVDLPISASGTGSGHGSSGGSGGVAVSGDPMSLRAIRTSWWRRPSAAKGDESGAAMGSGTPPPVVAVATAPDEPVDTAAADPGAASSGAASREPMIG